MPAKKRRLHEKKSSKVPPTSVHEKGMILVIDDDPLLLKTIRNVLEKAGYFVDTAEDGQEGILKAKTGFFHLVLCDIRMPGLDGIMTIRRIQDFQNNAGIGKSGFVVVTAYDTPDHQKAAFQLGVSDFVRKPFDLQAFLSVVDHNIRPLVKEHQPGDVRGFNDRLSRLIDGVDSSKA